VLAAIPSAQLVGAQVYAEAERGMRAAFAANMDKAASIIKVS
jgi:hypothetical protein